MKYLLLLLPLTLLAQIPGTFRVTGPVAPTATNSNYGAAVPVYNYGGLLTGLGSLSDLQNTNLYPVARRHSGQIAVLTNGVAYQLGSDLTTWTIYSKVNTTNGSAVNLSVSGGLTSSSDITVEGISIGNGPGNQASNTRFGSNAFNGTTLGQNNVVIGANAAPNATTPTNNVIIGSGAGASITSSDNNVVVGGSAYAAATFGSSNPSDPSYNTGAHNNIVLGRSTMANLYKGRNNFAAGTFSMFAATNGNFNVGLGTHTLNDLFIGDGNTAIGESSLYKTTGGFYNTALGYLAGYNASANSERNVYLGFLSGPSSLTTQSNKLYIHNAQGTPLIGGDFANYTVTIAGKLGLGVDPDPNKSLTTKNTGGILVENPSNVETEVAILATGVAFTGFGYNGSAVTNAYGARPGSAYFGTAQQKDVWIGSAGGRVKISTPDTVATHVEIQSIPTSAAGLASGTLWSDGGSVKVAPTTDTYSSGDVVIGTAGKGLVIKDNANGRVGIATLNGASPSFVVVSNNTVTTNTLIFLTRWGSNTSHPVSVNNITNGASFTINSPHNGDTDKVFYMLVEKIP